MIGLLLAILITNLAIFAAVLFYLDRIRDSVAAIYRILKSNSEEDTSDDRRNLS